MKKRKKKAVPLSALRAHFEFEELGAGLVTRIIDRAGLKQSTSAEVAGSASTEGPKFTSAKSFKAVPPERAVEFAKPNRSSSFMSAKEAEAKRQEAEAKRQADDLERLLSGMTGEDEQARKSTNPTQSRPGRAAPKQRRKK